jgi:hypothetical protein
MRSNHNFPINQFIAKVSALRRFDCVVAGVRITVHQAGMQDTDMRSMYLGNQAMWFETDFGVNDMGTSRVEHPIKERSLSRRCAKCGGGDAQKHDGDPLTCPTSRTSDY